MTSDSIQETCRLKFLSKISQFRYDRSFADVLIRVGDQEFYCHAVHLAAQSDYFKAALDKVWIKKREDGLAELDLSQFDEEAVESVIEFIYTGMVGFEGNGDISKIAEVADYLLICLNCVWPELVNSPQKLFRCLRWPSNLERRD
jgi:hypothetical protein